LDLNDIARLEYEKQRNNAELKSLREYYFAYLEDEGTEPYFLEDELTIVFQFENKGIIAQLRN
jgi:hypothetical protein